MIVSGELIFFVSIGINAPQSRENSPEAPKTKLSARENLRLRRVIEDLTIESRRSVFQIVCTNSGVVNRVVESCIWPSGHCRSMSYV